jgi:acyl CoA:acetate/3-ketoacid CoA transferase beta subunit
MSTIARHEYCAIALADALRGDGEILVSPIGALPTIAARLARLAFEPGLLLTDGVATLMGNVPPVGAPGEVIAEGWMPYRSVFDMVWSGRRHVIMGASQIDRYGNQNISAVGQYSKPKAQLLGMRGAPGNTINHPTSYWVPSHSTRVFVEKVDVVSGVGYDRARALSPRSTRFHEIRRVVSNLGVFDFATDDRRMRVASVHPGVSLDEIHRNTAFALVVPQEVPETRAPTDRALDLLRTRVDPNGLGAKELSA